jgi:hypothetical protein
VVLTARYIGRRPVSRTITVGPGSQEQNFELLPDPLRPEGDRHRRGEATAIKKRFSRSEGHR